MHTFRYCTPLIVVFLALLAGCTATERPEAWVEIPQADLTEAQAAQFEAADGARKAMFGGLMERLMAAMQDGGAPVAIEVCQEVAPAIAAETGATKNLRIGRTSFRLRNPDNTAPAWAAPYVAARQADPVVLHNTKDGSLAALFPIVLKAECVQCHGPKDSLDPAVRAALDGAYPQDEATGFEAGDLRGWFHATVPAA